MEHMPIPYSVRLGPEDAVPYVCSEAPPLDPYDGKSFLGFPERCHPNRAQLVSAVNEHNAVGLLRPLRPQPSGEGLEMFAQCWLFFGLLHEILGDAYNSGDFIRKDASLPATQESVEPKGLERTASGPHSLDDASVKMYITTEKLVKLVEDWLLCAQGPPGLDGAALQRIVACLDQAAAFLHGVPGAIRPSIRISIGSVINLFRDALRELGQDRLPSAFPLGLYDQEQLRRQLLRNGWCASSLWMFGIEGWGSLRSWFYLSHLDMRAPGRDHGDCSSTQCKALLSGPGKYARHVQDCSGSCEDVTIRGEDLTTIIKSGKLPVLGITHDERADAPIVRLQSADSGQTYVAISHVWADGLGNPDANSLPACQVGRVGRLVKALAVQKFYVVSETFVWIDTLCCPSSAFPEGKINALAMMRETYQNAKAVLVLDAGLQSIDSQNMTSLEICSRVVTSGWMLRLWTFQEAALANTLWAQFQDQARNVDHFASDNSLPHKHDLFRDLTADIFGAWVGLRPNTPMVNKALPHSGRLLDSIYVGVRRRVVSFASDEPLCIAALLGLPSRGIAELPAEERMTELWRLMKPGDIPQWVVFLNRPKLAQPGFRWAPRTLMLGDRWDFGFALLAPIKGVRYGTLCPEGLQVHYPGGIFHMTGRASWLPPSPFWLKEGSLRLARLRTTSGRWYHFFIGPMQDGDPEFFKTYNKGQFGHPSQQLALLWYPAFDYNKPNGSALGVLAEYTKTDHSVHGTVHYVHFLRHVTLGRNDPAATALYEASYQAAVDLLSDPVTTQLRKLSESNVPVDRSQSSAFTKAVDALRTKMSHAAEEIQARFGLAGGSLTEGQSIKVQKTFEVIEQSYSGYVGEMTMEFPESCCWCVD